MGAAASPLADDVVALGDQVGGALEAEVGERGPELLGEVYDPGKYLPYAVKSFFDNGGRRAYIVRALAWTRCIERPYQLRFRDAFAARLMGDALGNLIPFLSVAVSEPSKAVFVKHRVPLLVGLSALAIENIFYALSVAIFIFSGTATL